MDRDILESGRMILFMERKFNWRVCNDMAIRKKKSAQDLCNELFNEVEASLSDAWISDSASTEDPKQYLFFVQGSLYALEDARKIIKAFLNKYKNKV